MTERVAALPERVRLSREHMTRYPDEFSGGQRQRIGIARALAVHSDFIMADEPVSALNLPQDLRADLGLTMVLIGHDLGLAEIQPDQVAVLYLGRVTDTQKAGHCFSAACSHDRCQTLVSWRMFRWAGCSVMGSRQVGDGTDTTIEQALVRGLVDPHDRGFVLGLPRSGWRASTVSAHDRTRGFPTAFRPRPCASA